ncbi:type I deoxyribonuclease HsdR [Patiriisocius marinistellae]|uniref:Type I deoxyribonuclease HsdR n=2 Tax=Patiriisocius marinistellae TaxID=2494560 RepID=A0A5J4FWX7_9FLAO|nr:type I deoxyribonuclease HsdR [Patiriisocius marinistellae]
MVYNIIRFWANGWIKTLYNEPSFHFKYFGFEWVQTLGVYNYALFIICGIAALCVALGFKYRIASIIFFLSFTYIELIDKTTYLNHYYFISCMAFLLMFLPANAYFSIDAYQNKNRHFATVPRWTIDVIKALLFIVYFYAGLAKLNSDWLLEAMPLKIWLPSKYDIPFFGNVLQQEWLHYVFSWGGMLYDLMIPFLLLYKPTRKVAFFLVIVFHVLTRVLFPIGVFPFVMIVSALIFFDASFHQKIINGISKLFKISEAKIQNNITSSAYLFNSKMSVVIVAFFLLIQVLLPWRYLAYPGELFWTEEGYRFSWRVMLMEKAGYAQFKIKNSNTGSQFLVNNSDFLTSFQEKQMSTQPDFIIQYAHFLGDYFAAQGQNNIEVYVESYVAINGRLSQSFVDPSVNLLKVKETFKPRDFLLPFGDEIKGL